MRRAGRAALLAWVLALAARARAAEPIRLTIYHTSDIHGWIMPRAADWNKDDPKRQVGGFAALAKLVRADKGPKLLLDSGDWFQGTPEGYVSRGEAVTSLFNALGYDAVLIGNHDFDFGAQRLKELISGLKMPALGANILDARSRKRVPWAKPWIIVKVAGVKVGILGVTRADMRALTFPDNVSGLEFRRAVDAAKDAVAELKAADATVIVALTHLGFENPDMGPFEGDQTLAREVPGIDVILGGHTHKLLKDPPRVGDTLITEPGLGLTAVDKVTLDIEPTLKKVISSKGELVTLWTDQLGQDSRIAELVRRQAERAASAFDVIVGMAVEPLRRDRQRESAMGDWFTDCERSWSGADVAFSNGAGIRGEFAEGPISLRAIYDVMPFDNHPVKLKLTGARLQAALDHGAGLGWEMVQVSGASFSYDRAAPEGARVRDLKIAGKPVDSAAGYSVETTDFLVSGGEGFAFGDAEAKPDKTLLRDVLRGCVQTQALVKAPPGGRMIPLEDDRGTEKRAR